MGDVDLDNYCTKEEMNEEMSDKVDKVEGKGLSTNDFTNEYKNQLDNEMVGKITDVAGAEIFNDYENNQAVSCNSHAEGARTKAGTKAFKIIALSGTVGGEGTYTLDNTTGIEVGMRYSAVTSIAAYNGGTITAVDGNKVKVDNYPGHPLNTAIDNPDNFDLYNLFIIVDHPELGSIDAGFNAHTEGNNTYAAQVDAHAEGRNTRALGKYAHAEGLGTQAGHASHAEGQNTIASGARSHAEGDSTYALGSSAHAEGYDTHATNNQAHAEGNSTKAFGSQSHAEGYNSTASGDTSHAEGASTTASGHAAHAEGTSTTASGHAAHAEGDLTYATSACAHAEGYNTQATNNQTHAEGNGTIASGSQAHAEGTSTTASGARAHAEGYGTKAEGDTSHAEGDNTRAAKHACHAEGSGTQATGDQSHAEGLYTIASGYRAHAEGWSTEAKMGVTHSAGIATVAGYDGQTVVGIANENKADNLFEVGNGSYYVESDKAIATTRSNALEVKTDGTVNVQKGFAINGVNIIDMIYPVGSLYWSSKATNPFDLFGVGTWTRIKDKFVLAAGEEYKVGKIGGAAKHKLTIDEMPAHWHENRAITSGGVNTALRLFKSNAADGSGWDMLTNTGENDFNDNLDSYAASRGGGLAHENMPPYVVYYCWERTA
jgi:hypothetical protein